MKALVVDIVPFEFSTRARKMSTLTARFGSTTFLSLRAAGRYGLVSNEGERLVNGVRIRQLRGRVPQTDRSFRASLENLLLCYVPGLLRLGVAVLREEADVVFVENPVLIPIGLAHRARWRSMLVFDGRERPGGIRTRGSIAAWLSRVEPFLHRSWCRYVDLCIAVADTHASAYRLLGFGHVLTIRNVPSVVKPAEPIDDSVELRLAYVGTLYPGRGVEMLIRAVGIARSRGVEATASVTGAGAPDYLRRLGALIESLELTDAIRFEGPCRADEVPERYAAAHIGCVLYEAVDPANDSLSNKLFDVMSSGRCVLATDLPETTGIVRRFACGVAVAPDAEALASAIEMLSKNRSDVRAWGANAWVAVSQRLNWDTESAPLNDWLGALGSRAARRGQER